MNQSSLTEARAKLSTLVEGLIRGTGLSRSPEIKD